MNEIIKVILEGIYDEGSILSSLRGTPHIVKEIWSILKNHYCKLLIKLPKRFNYENNKYPEPEMLNYHEDFVVPDFQFIKQFEYYEVLDHYQETDSMFPKPSGININMMPYIYGGEKFKDYRLPDYVKPYFSLIRFCSSGIYYDDYSVGYDYSKDKGKVFYLTIQEGWVEANQSQRRPGVHTDNPGSIKIKNHGNYLSSTKGGGTYSLSWFTDNFWGAGEILSSGNHKGGIFMASTVPNSCRAWDCKIEQDRKTGFELIGKHGSLEHCKDFLPDDCEVIMEPNTLYWITDRTPHESLPLLEKTYRQFFRVVTENVSFWFADHSTANPLGVLPVSSITKIVKGNKFDADSLAVVKHSEYRKKKGNSCKIGNKSNCMSKKKK